jgi:hypothetical protein
MKNSKTFAATALSLMLAWLAHGQSSFWLNNYFNEGVNAPVYDSQGAPLVGSNYLAELWGEATTDSLTPAITYWTRQRVIIPFLTGTAAGYFYDPYAGRDGTDALCVFAVPPEGWAWLQVRAWAAHLGGTYEQAVSLGLGGYGASPFFYAKGSGPGGTLPNPPAALTGLQSFNLLPEIPEPSAVGLLMLGGLLLFWRERFRG